MKQSDKFIKKLNPDCIESPKYDLKVIKVVNKWMKWITKEQIDLFIKRIKNMWFEYVCFWNVERNLDYVSSAIKCWIFVWIWFIDSKTTKWPWQDVWTQVYEKEWVYIVTPFAEYKEVVKVIWDWKNDKIFKYENNKI